MKNSIKKSANQRRTKKLSLTSKIIKEEISKKDKESNKYGRHQIKKSNFKFKDKEVNGHQKL